MNPNSVSPILKGQGLSKVGHAAILACISALFVPGRPAAILRRVRAVIVDALKRAAQRPRAHILDKATEAIAPGRTHVDAAATIVGVLLVLGAGAAFFSRGPDAVLRHSATAMGGTHLSCAFIFQAPATLDAAAAQMTSRNECVSATVASTEPHSMSALTAGALDYNEPAKTLGNEWDGRTGHWLCVKVFIVTRRGLAYVAA